MYRHDQYWQYSDIVPLLRFNRCR